MIQRTRFFKVITALLASASATAQAQVIERTSSHVDGGTILGVGIIVLAIIGLVGLILCLCRRCSERSETVRAAVAAGTQAAEREATAEEAARRARERQQLEDAFMAARDAYQLSPTPANGRALAWAERILARFDGQLFVAVASVIEQRQPAMRHMEPSPFCSGQTPDAWRRVAAPAAPAQLEPTPQPAPAPTPQPAPTPTPTPAAVVVPSAVVQQQPAQQQTRDAPSEAQMRLVNNILTRDMRISRADAEARIRRELGANPNRQQVSDLIDHLREEVEQRRGGGQGGGQAAPADQPRPLGQGQLVGLRRRLQEAGVTDEAQQNQRIAAALGVADIQQPVTKAQVDAAFDTLTRERDEHRRQQQAGGGQGNQGGGGTGGGTGGNAPTPPAAPVKVTGLLCQAGDGQVELTWDDVADATGYRVSWTSEGGQAGIADAAGPSHKLEGLENGKKHTITVAAMNGSVVGEASDPIESTPAAAPAQP